MNTFRMTVVFQRKDGRDITRDEVVELSGLVLRNLTPDGDYWVNGMGITEPAQPTQPAQGQPCIRPICVEGKVWNGKDVVTCDLCHGTGQVTP